MHPPAHVPRMALKANWRFADRPTLRIFMHRLGELEAMSLPGPVRSRFRAKRLAAVEFYREHLGELAEQTPSVSSNAYRRRYERPHHAPRIPVARVSGHLLFSRHAL